MKPKMKPRNRPLVRDEAVADEHGNARREADARVPDEAGCGGVEILLGGERPPVVASRLTHVELTAPAHVRARDHRVTVLQPALLSIRGLTVRLPV
jgi:hypothetical protein